LVAVSITLRVFSDSIVVKSFWPSALRAHAMNALADFDRPDSLSVPRSTMVMVSPRLLVMYAFMVPFFGGDHFAHSARQQHQSEHGQPSRARFHFPPPSVLKIQDELG